MAVPTLDRVLTDNNKIFDHDVYIYFEFSYKIQIKYVIFNQNFLTSKLMTFLTTNNLGISTLTLD